MPDFFLTELNRGKVFSVLNEVGAEYRLTPISRLLEDSTACLEIGWPEGARPARCAVTAWRTRCVRDHVYFTTQTQDEMYADKYPVELVAGDRTAGMLVHVGATRGGELRQERVE